MRIGLFLDAYSPTVSGVTIQARLLQRALLALGESVWVIALGTSSQEEPAPTIRVPSLPIGKSGFFYNWRFPPYLQKFIQSLDVLHCHHPFISAKILAHQRHKHQAFLSTHHTRYDLYTHEYSPQWLYPLAQRVVNSALMQHWQAIDTLVCPSAAISELLKLQGCPAPLVTIPNGIVLEPFTRLGLAQRHAEIAENGWHFAFVGRLAPEKNIPALLEAFRLACEQTAERLQLSLVGDGAELVRLQQLAVELGLGESVHFHGQIAYAQLPEFLARVNVFVTPSTSEVHPLSVIEALAAGCPVVAWQSPALQGLVQNGQNGFLVGNSTHELANGLLRLISQADSLPDLSEKARKSVALFSIEQTAKQTLALYRKTLDNCRREQAHTAQ